MIGHEELRAYLVSAYDPDDLVNALEIDIEELVDILWIEILQRQDKLYYVDREEDEEL